MTATTVTTFFSILTVIAVALVVGWVALTVAARGSAGAARLRHTVVASLDGYTLGFAWIVATVCTLGSLYYSEIVHFEPCKLCWIQRIGMYPLAVILLIAMVRRDDGARLYAYPLAMIGGLFAVYHYTVQLFPSLEGECSLAVPCSTREIWRWGFMSMPFMSASGFALILVFLWAGSAADRLNASEGSDEVSPAPGSLAG